MNFTLVKGHHHFFSIVVCSISIYDMIGEPVEKTPHTHTHRDGFRFLGGKIITGKRQQKPAPTRSKTKDIKTAGNMHVPMGGNFPPTFPPS